MEFWDLKNVTFTSSGTGTINGNGESWWGFISYLVRSEIRPKLIQINNSEQLLVNNLEFIDSPYWTFTASNCRNVEIHHSKIDARRNKDVDWHDKWNLGAFNTDGFDVSGQNFYIHDVDIWNQDDCIVVKQVSKPACSENMLFERIKASGIGLVIGSVGGNTCTKNITFRDAYMHHTWKGIYIKFRPGDTPSEVTNINFENITMDEPTQWPIWIGPQQASYEGNCDILWPSWSNKCPVPNHCSVSDITLKDILIKNSQMSPGFF